MNDLTNSMKFINTTSGKILIDCGTSNTPYARNLNTDLLQRDSFKEIIAVIVTNAKINHTEYILQILDNGFAGPIFCTSHIFEEIRKILTSFLEKQDKTIESKRLKEILKHVHTYEFGERFKIDETENYFIYNGNTPKAPSVIIQRKDNKMVISNSLEKNGNNKLLPPTALTGSCDFFRLDCDDILPSIWETRDL